MSKVKIQGHASGTGVLTITAPNTSTDRTITLPDTTGTLLDENSSLPAANLTGTVADARISTLTASKLTGALPAISGASLTGISGGKILQVVQTEHSTQVTCNNTVNPCQTGLTGNITPSATSSKILVMWNCGGYMKQPMDAGCTFYLYKDGSELKEVALVLDNSTSSGYAQGGTMSGQYLDSPNTTSAITYDIRFKGSSGSANMYNGRNGTDQSLVLMEVGA